MFVGYRRQGCPVGCPWGARLDRSSIAMLCLQMSHGMVAPFVSTSACAVADVTMCGNVWLFLST